MFLFSAATIAVVGTIAAVVAGNVQQPLTVGPHITHHLSSGNETIYNVLSHQKQFSKLTKVINFADKISSVLNDSSAQITFFAVPNRALHRPHKRHFESTDIAALTQAYDLADAVDLVEEFQSLATGDGDGKDKEKYRKFLKKLIQAILSYHILPEKFDVQHLAESNTFATELVLPEALGTRPVRIRVAHSLLSPIPTVNFYSKVVHPDNKALNGVIHIINHPLLPPPPAFQDLFLAPSIFATFVSPVIFGLVQSIDRPLFFKTSAVQRTGLTDLLDLRYVHGKKDEKEKLEGTKAVTVFAPTNRAFQELPLKLRLFLFSPFGTSVLRKVLEYHIVPGIVFHTDYIYNSTDKHHMKHKDKNFLLSKVGPLGTDLYPLQYRSTCSEVPLDENLINTAETTAVQAPARSVIRGANLSLQPLADASEVLHPHPEPIETIDATLLTALANHTLHAHVEKFKFNIPLPGPHKPPMITTKFSINGHQVAVPDIIALNGAVHLVEHLLDPRGHSHRGHHGHHGSLSTDKAGGIWEEWEEWLPQWAAEI
ncbi:hypothetical protein H0H87_001469 [Tephrocybe sp. NHM501043]|nr:hypothetical protein H0H87_001469 [Tephrocybe sp. NHM501043]